MTAAIPEQTDELGYELGGTPQIQKAWRILAGGSQKAARALIDIAEFGRNEVARVQAAKAVLEMVGFSTGSDVTVKVIPAEYDAMAPSESRVSPSAVIEARMAALRRGDSEADDVIEDAVIVDAD